MHAFVDKKRLDEANSEAMEPSTSTEVRGVGGPTSCRNPSLSAPDDSLVINMENAFVPAVSAISKKHRREQLPLFRLINPSPEGTTDKPQKLDCNASTQRPAMQVTEQQVNHHSHLQRRLTFQANERVKHARIVPLDGEPQDRLWGLKQFFKDAFLPLGYPDSVSDDYIRYQVCDSLQAFASAITGLIATRSMLKGVGVGSAEATATSAVLTFVYKDGAAALSKILFAYGLGGTVLDSDCKTWRFLADILNDAGLMMEVLAAQLPRPLFLPTTMAAQVLKACCGVAAGATKAALSSHFAKNDNFADLNAKESSQETLVGLLGMLVGSYVVQRIPDRFFSIWATLIFFTIIHLFTNYIGVRSCVFDTLNRQRATLVIREFLQSNKVLPPAIAAGKERILYFGDSVKPKIRIGPSLSQVRVAEETFKDICAALREEKYLIVVQKEINVILLQGCTQKDVLKGFFHAMLLQRSLRYIRAVPSMPSSLEKTNQLFPIFLEKLHESGWKNFEDKPGLREGPWRASLKHSIQ